MKNATKGLQEEVLGEHTAAESEWLSYLQNCIVWLHNMQKKFGICPATSTSNNIPCILGDLPSLPCLTLMLELAKKERMVNFWAVVVADVSDKEKSPLFGEWQKEVLKTTYPWECIMSHSSSLLRQGRQVCGGHTNVRQ